MLAKGRVFCDQSLIYINFVVNYFYNHSILLSKFKAQFLPVHFLRTFGWQCCALTVYNALLVGSLISKRGC